MKVASGVLALSFLLAACGKKTEEETSQGNLQFTMKPTGNVAASLALLDSAATDFRNTSIASGNPASLTLYVTKMILKKSDGSSQMTIFSETDGKPIYVNSKTVDISKLFTTYACVDSSGNPVKDVKECPCGLDSDKKAIAKGSDDKCPDSGGGAVGVTSVNEGTFDTLSVEFQVRAKVKGCVAGNFSSVSSNGTGTQGSRTYCTKSTATTFQSTVGVASASSLEGTLATAEEMDYQVVKANELYSDAKKTQNLEFPIKNSVTITKGAVSTPQLTFMIDTNRMLRFYNQNRTQEPSPGMPSNRSYFFNSVLEESTFVFVGKPGDIRGFQWWTDACTGDGTNVPTCSSSTNVVAGWMTVIKDSDTKPLVVGLMPDDDNSLTIIKGSNKDKSGINAGYFTASGSNYDIKFDLGSDSGTLKGVNLDAALDSSQTATFLGFQKYGGKVYFKRKL